jgi:hypothetical protein
VVGDQSELDVGQFAIRGGRARQYPLKTLWAGVDADALEAPAQLSRLSAPKIVMSHLQLMREFPSFVAPGVRRGRHKPGV